MPLLPIKITITHLCKHITQNCIKNIYITIHFIFYLLILVQNLYKVYFCNCFSGSVGHKWDHPTLSTLVDTNLLTTV